MPTREWNLRILDILECIGKIRRYTKGMSKADLAGDAKTFDAVARNFQIIGEAANHVPKRICEKYPAIRWADIRGMRNIIVHVYFGIDMEAVWRAVTQELDELEKRLIALRASEGF